MPDDERPPLPPYVRGRPTSRAAAESVRDESQSLMEKLYRWGNRRGPKGWTDEESEIASERKHQSISSRRRTLCIHRRVGWTGRKKKNLTLRPANIWITDQVSREHGIPFVPLKTNNADRLAFVEVHCRVVGPDGRPIESREDLDAQIKRFYGGVPNG